MSFRIARMRFSLVGLIAVLAAVGLVSLSTSGPASAAKAGKVTICHATGDATNPYVEITVSENAIDAHRAHQDGEDIIPAPAAGCNVPVDVCPNIPGDQPTVPEGLIVDGAGNCVLPPQPCSQATASGGFGITVTSHELGVSGPLTFQFDYNTVFQPDHIVIRYEGNVIFDTGGPVSTNDMVVTAMVNVPAGTSTQIEVTVDGVEAGTVWDYTVHCPVTA